jgi:hypothetical protein
MEGSKPLLARSRTRILLGLGHRTPVGGMHRTRGRMNAKRDGSPCGTDGRTHSRLETSETDGLGAGRDEDETCVERRKMGSGEQGGGGVNVGVSDALHARQSIQCRA